jgi:hypothetical protein
MMFVWLEVALYLPNAAGQADTAVVKGIDKICRFWQRQVLKAANDITRFQIDDRYWIAVIWGRIGWARRPVSATGCKGKIMTADGDRFGSWHCHHLPFFFGGMVHDHSEISLQVLTGGWHSARHPSSAVIGEPGKRWMR